MNGDGQVDSHDVFTALSKGYQTILGNDILALAKVNYLLAFSLTKLPIAQMQSVSKAAKRKSTKVDISSIPPILDYESATIIAFSDFRSSLSSRHESDLGRDLSDTIQFRSQNVPSEFI